jgi:dihydrolipoamide dehydrogenase
MSQQTIAVIGSGPGGHAAAVRASQLGYRVIVIERNGLGGVCLQSGCIPVKTLFHAVRVYETARNSGSLGIHSPETTFDFPEMLSNMRKIVATNEKGIAHTFSQHGISIISGIARLTSPTQIAVDIPGGGEESVVADAIIIASGSRTATPPFIEIDGSHIFDCEGALEQTVLPDNIAILGGGVLGCEFASLYAALGIPVTIVEQADTLLPGWDSTLSRRLTKEFRRRGIDIRTGTGITGVTRSETGVTIALDGKETVTAHRCLAALGRTPNVEGLGLEECGIETMTDGRPGIHVDEHMLTSAPGVYAVGDVTGIQLLAHVATAQGIAAVEHAAGSGSSMSYRAVPECFWGFPELATVGMTAGAATADGRDIAVGRVPFRALGAAQLLGAGDGYIEVVTDSVSGTVLGIHICGPGAPELIAEATVIVDREMTIDEVTRVIHAHPTLGELIREGVAAAGVSNRNIR